MFERIFRRPEYPIVGLQLKPDSARVQLFDQGIPPPRNLLPAAPERLALQQLYASDLATCGQTVVAPGQRSGRTDAAGGWDFGFVKAGLVPRHASRRKQRRVAPDAIEKLVIGRGVNVPVVPPPPVGSVGEFRHPSLELGRKPDPEVQAER